MPKIDLNVDIAEGFPHDDALLSIATSANICCGVHAGCMELTCTTIEMCKTQGIRIGCHPGYPDRDSMGRAMLDILPESWRDSIFEQVAWFAASGICEYVKPHGAWYNQIVSGHRQSLQLLDRIETTFALPIMILPAANRPKQINEGFGDRGYTATGTLIPRSEPGAILTESEDIETQALALAPQVDSICVHGDGVAAVHTLLGIRKALEKAGWEISAW